MLNSLERNEVNMIKSIVIKLAKKYILNSVNDLLMEYKENVNNVT